MIYQHKYEKYKQKYQKLKQIMGFMSSINLLAMESSKSFIFQNINLTDHDNRIINSLKFDLDKGSNIFEYYGILHVNKLRILISKFIINLDNTQEKSFDIANILITKIIEPFLKAMNKDSLWFVIRIMPVAHSQNIPRWHTDGYYYKNEEYFERNQNQYKLAGTLIGPGTIFKMDNKEMRNKYFELFKELYKNPEKEKIIAKSLAKYDECQPNQGEIVIFVVGNNKQAAVHSEPKFEHTRFFFSIVPGDEIEIKDLAMFRKVEFNE
jgi:hypothetical protein